VTDSGPWTPEDDSRLADLIRLEFDAEGLDPFIRRMSPRLPPPRHLEPAINLWERTRRGPVRAVLSMPPRHAKTTTAMHGLAWRLTLDPALTHCYATYADALSVSKSRIARRLARGAGVRLARDQQNLHEWRTVQGGGFLATGVGGPLTGQGVTGVAIVDDPIKNRKEAESATIREGIWDWFRDVLWTRLEEDASVVVIQTRWHPHDLAGKLLADGVDGVRFEDIRLPALAEDPGDLLGRQVGEALWPGRYPVEKLAEIRSLLGAYGWASLYQQRPRPRGDQLFYEPGRFELDTFSLDGHRLVIVCDPAATESTRADYSVIMVLAAKGWGADMRVWVLDHFRAQITVPKLVRRLGQLQRQWYGVPIGVEAVGGFKGIPQMLREHDPALRLLEVKPIGDKFTRAQPASSAWNEGRILVPTDRPWGGVLIAECQDFTGVKDDHDDQVDCLAHGFNVLFAAKEPRRRRVRRATHAPFG